MRHIRRSLPVVILIAQNLAVFWGHYFRGVGFPWDFPMGYYATVAFWTSAMTAGIFPHWVPFQSMGYPQAMNLQMGVYYPPFWVFPLLRIPYTLTAAVVVQCLHVFAGSVGMYLLLRRCCESKEYAVVGAVAFQFFGGFYCNAEHADIVRAFALAPWLFYVYSLGANNARLPRRTLMIPLVIYMLATGGYPGNFMSGLFVMALYVLAQVAERCFTTRDPKASLSVAARVLALSGVGLAMASISSGPAWIERGQLTRVDQVQGLLRMGLWVEHLPGLFLSSRTLPGEVSMTSTYITLPALVFASFVPLSRLRRYAAYLVVGVVSLLMVPGTRSPVWLLLTGAVPVLRLSRFPTSDYRVHVAIPLIVLSVVGLRAIARVELRRLDFLIRCALALVWIPAGVYAAYRGTWGVPALLTALSAGAVLVAVVFLRLRLPPSGLVVSVATVLVLLDGFRVLPDMSTWRSPDITAWHNSFVPLRRNGEFVPGLVFAELPVFRPARVQASHVHNFSWRGYLDGTYMMHDIGNTVLQARAIVESNPLYEEYMLREWQPLYLEPDLLPNGGANAPLADSVLAGALTSTDDSAGPGRVEQTLYGVNDITYEVSLSRLTLMVENEIFFPGWSATLTGPDGQVRLQAVAVNDVFRAWLLPAGHYQMRAHFEFPRIWLYRGVSLAAFVAWLSILSSAINRAIRIPSMRRGCGRLPPLQAPR